LDELRKYIIENQLGEALENRSFREYTTLQVGGKIRLVYLPDTVENFLKFYHYYKTFNLPLFVIGAGSNVFASDDYFNGVVVNFSRLILRYYRIGDIFTCYPGCSVVLLAHRLAKIGYQGGEFLGGIPATIGGAVYMNAGANGREIKDILISAKLLCADGTIKEYKNADLHFGYRKSLLQEGDYIVLEAKFRFTPASPAVVSAYLQELKAKRKASQPIEEKCAGCTFQNPPGHSAWQLIDKIGFRGYRINQAQVSEKHSNFLINKGGATSADLLELIRRIQAKVKEEFNIDLKCEWILVNFPD
jgi:UDP-N-acetylmuramate dehydrogenase